MKSPAARQVFPNLFEDIVKRALNTVDDIARFEGVITRSRSKLDFPVAEGVYMLPSDMSLIEGKINGFNNAIKVAGANVKIGEINTSVNSQGMTIFKHIEKKPPGDKNPVRTEHEDEKQALVIAGVAVINIWFFKR